MDQETVEKRRILKQSGFLPIPSVQVRFSVVERKIISNSIVDRINTADLDKWISSPTTPPPGWQLWIEANPPEAAVILEAVNSALKSFFENV